MKLPFGYYFCKPPPYYDALVIFLFGPSKKYTQICFAIHKQGIHIHNNVGGQLGPNSLSVLIWWKPMKFIYSSNKVRLLIMRTAQEILDGHRAFIQEKSKSFKVVRVEDIDTWSREYIEGVIREAKVEGRAEYLKELSEDKDTL